MDLVSKEEIEPIKTFRVGDFFLDVTKNVFYVFTFREGWLRLVSIEGDDVAKVFADIDSANYFLESFINKGEYKHYPQDEFEMLIMRKGNEDAS